MTTEPSPRPWQVIKMHGLDEDDVRVYVADAHNSAIARIVAYAENDEANAALIVAAVNERDRLRDIVRRAIPFVEGIVNASALVNADDPDIVPFMTKEQKAVARKAHEEAVPLLAEARAAIGEDKP